MISKSDDLDLVFQFKNETNKEIPFTKIVKKYQEHLIWLKDKDPLQRATQGFTSAINFIKATDNTHLIDTFWRKTYELDHIRDENVLDIIPELSALK
jgi:hypothetical protein